MSALGAAAIFSIGLVVVIVAFLVLTTFNSVVAMRQRIRKAWANIDVVLKQRHDELPNLVEAVKDVMTYEQETLTRVTDLRAAYRPDAPVPAQATTSDATTAAVRQLLAVVERYPELRSRSNVLALQAEIERLEQLIAARRELYNDTVYRYNARIQQAPTNLLAVALGWRPQPFFEATAAEAARPAVDLVGG